MAEENLGTAVLRIVVDDDQARATLDKLKSDIRQVETNVSRTTSTRTTSRATSGPSTPAGFQFGSISRQDVSRFNLRGFTASLQSIADDLNNVATARNLNINSSWTAALATLSEVQEGLQTIAAGKKLNIDASWASALTTLSEVQQDLQGIAAAKKLNLRSSWGAFLTDLTETKTDIDSSAAAKRINIKSSWVKFLGELEEVAQELAQLQRSPATQAAVNASLERRAELRSLQTAGGGGGGLTNFLRDIRIREESEKRIAAKRTKGYKQADFAERTLQTFAQKRLTTATREQRIRAQTQRSQISGVLSSAVIGGAFPLLFGQGGGAATGGLIGGLFGGIAGQGGGFAGSLAGTLIGQQLDVFNQLAKALQDPVANFQQLVEGSNLSSRALERYIEVLIESGRTAEAEAAIRADISRTIDPTTLAQASAANDQYARTIADVQKRLGTLLSGPASQFVSWLEDIIKRIAFLPSPDQGPISAQGRQQLSLANRGAGTALGLGGIAIAGLSAATGFFPGVLAGGAIAATGGAQFALGESQQEQVALSKLLAGAQQEILSVEQKRITVQKQLVDLTERGSTSGTKELQFQASLLDIDAKRAKAKADFLARDASTASFRAYQLELEALKLTEKQLRANETVRLRNLSAQRQLDVELTDIKLQSITKQITATQALSKTERGVARDTLATTQNIQAAIDAAKAREREIGAQISRARQIGDEAGAAELVNQQKVAANQTRLELEKGALSLRDAGEQLRKDVASAALNLVQIRSDPQGLNRFLGPITRQQRAAFDFQRLLPQFREAQTRFESLTGAQAPEFRGSAQAVNKSIIDFIQSVNREFDATNALVQSQQAANTINQELISVNNQLATVTKALADKNWLVNVAVEGGVSSVYGDAVNAALSP